MLTLETSVLKRDMGLVFEGLEAYHEQLLRAGADDATTAGPPPMTDADRSEAMTLLRDPRLIDRIVEDFGACGVVGEETNKIVGYLAATSRLLERPLAVVIQSSSAAGKSSLMDAVLAFIPEEERVKFSAITGQSLYYMGTRT